MSGFASTARSVQSRDGCARCALLVALLVGALVEPALGADEAEAAEPGEAELLDALAAFDPEAPTGTSPQGFSLDASLQLLQRFNAKRNMLNLDQSFSVGMRAGRLGVTGAENPLNLRFDKDELGYSALLAGRLSARLSRFGLVLALDSGEVKFRPLLAYDPAPDCSSGDVRCESVTANGRPIGDEAKESLFLREVFLQARLGNSEWLDLRAGKLLLSAGGGFLMDNYALGLSAQADLDEAGAAPVRLELDAVFPNGDFSASGKRSPLIYAEAAWLRSWLEEIGLFAGYFHDGDSNLAEILRSVMLEVVLHGDIAQTADPRLLYAATLEADIQTEGDLFYLGVHGNLLFARGSLSWTAAVEFGSFSHLTTLPRAGTFPGLTRTGRSECLGGMLHLATHWDVTERLTLGGFFLYLSGESFSADDIRSKNVGRFGSFIGIYPWITATNLFFSGGMNQTFGARSLSASGVNARGVLAPGLDLGWDIVEGLTLRLVGATLFSQGAHLDSGGRFYGVEADLNLSWDISCHLQLLAEADYLWTGDFFDFEKPLEEPEVARSMAREPGVFKAIVGLNLFF
ncbi:MAG: hypothetical protein GYA21_16325 [Myxococcales bacterium]|nr:hypothetical protein [Myxococcales bacterium]